MHHKHGEQVSLIINVRKLKLRHAVLFALIVLLTAWYAATPSVVIHYPKEATDELRLVWDTQHQIHRERMLPGEASSDVGHLFPDEDFFMVFFWGPIKGHMRCIDITPKRWATLDIYLTESGRVDINKTSPAIIERLKKCEGEPDPFRH